MAWEDPHSQTAYRAEGERILNQLIDMLKDIGASQSAVDFVREKLAQFAEPSQTICARLVQAIEQQGGYQV